MALDYGDRYIGVAVSDKEGKIALRHSVIDTNKSDLILGVNKVIEIEEVEKIVVGMPKGLAGRKTLQSQKTIEFIELLRHEVDDDIVVEEEDEMFTSLEAKRKINEEGGKKEEEHAEAARLILESYISSRL